MTEQEAKARAEEICAGMHCRYCDRDYKCPQDHADLISEVAKALLAASGERDGEIKKLQAVFDSVAPTNSRAYEGLLGTGQALIDKDAEIADLRARLEAVKADRESDERILMEIHIALDGLPVSGSAEPGVKSVPHFSASKQIRQLRARLEAAEKRAGEVEEKTRGLECTRSHPHELMSPVCELKTEIARLRNEQSNSEAIQSAIAGEKKP